MAIFGALVAGIAFSIIFQLRYRDAIIAGIGGMLGYLIYVFVLAFDGSNNSAFFIASMGFSLYAEVCARKFKVPVLTYLVIGLLILVPGKGMYMTMFEIVQHHNEAAINVGIETLANAGSLALGTIIMQSFVKIALKFKSKHHH